MYCILFLIIKKIFDVFDIFGFVLMICKVGCIVFFVECVVLLIKLFVLLV